MAGAPSSCGVQIRAGRPALVLVGLFLYYSILDGRSDSPVDLRPR